MSGPDRTVPELGLALELKTVAPPKRIAAAVAKLLAEHDACAVIRHLADCALSLREVVPSMPHAVALRDAARALSQGAELIEVYTSPEHTMAHAAEVAADYEASESPLEPETLYASREVVITDREVRDGVLVEVDQRRESLADFIEANLEDLSLPTWLLELERDGRSELDGHAVIVWA